MPTTRRRRTAKGQLDLFDPRAQVPRRAHSLPASGPPAVAVRTSIAAAERIASDAPTLRGKVYTAIVEAGEAGVTRQEICDRLGMKLQTVCGRVFELKEFGLVYEGEEAREGRRVVRARRKV